MKNPGNREGMCCISLSTVAMSAGDDGGKRKRKKGGNERKGIDDESKSEMKRMKNN
jgi:hypothetical protein